MKQEPSRLDSVAPPARRLRIALISPKGPLYRHRGGIFGRSLRYMPLTLPTLAALIPDCLDVELICIDEGIAEVPDALDVDLIGMTVITGTAPRAYELAARFRARGMTVVLGGPHITLVPEDARDHADSLVVGYAEQSWPALLHDFVAGRMKPRYVADGSFDLAQSPLPRRSVLPRHKYITSHVFEATRGCIHSCEFCVVPSAWGRKPFQKPVEQVVADIEQQGARRAIFIDLNLIADRNYATGLFQALIPLRLQWYGLATTLLCEDQALLDLAARSGCRGLLMGFESIEVGNLKLFRKGFNRPEGYRKIVDMLHDRGISLQGCFVFGMDEDREDVFEKTAKFAVEAHIDLPRFAIATPFPGTPFHDKLAKQSRILTRDWSLYDGQHAVFQPKHMTPRQLERGTEAAWKYAYRWSSIAERVRHSGGPWHVSLLTNLGYRFYANRLHRFYTCDMPFSAPHKSGSSDHVSAHSGR